MKALDNQSLDNQTHQVGEEEEGWDGEVGLVGLLQRGMGRGHGCEQACVLLSLQWQVRQLTNHMPNMCWPNCNHFHASTSAFSTFR